MNFAPAGMGAVEIAPDQPANTAAEEREAERQLQPKRAEWLAAHGIDRLP